MHTADILTAVAAAGTTFTLPGIWSGIEGDRDCFVLDTSPDALLAILKSKFREADLLAAGVAEQLPTGGLQLAPQLQVSSPIWASRGQPNAPLEALVTEAGVIGSRETAVSLAINECGEGYLKPNNHDYVVANTMVDFAILRALKAPAIPGLPIRDLSRTEVRALLSLLGASNDTEYTTHKRYITYCLCDFSLELLEPREFENVARIWQALDIMAKHCELECKHVRRWRPSEKTIETIKVNLEYFGAEEVASIIEHSQWADPRTQAPSIQPAKSRAEVLGELYARTAAVERSTIDSGRPPSMHEQMFLDLDQERVTPLLEVAAKTTDPVRRNLILSLVELLQLQLPIQQLITQRMRTQLSRWDERNASLPAEDLRIVMMLMSQVRSLYSELIKCQTPKQRPRDPQSTAPQSSHWDSIPRRWPR
jgi:hypothetical protein